MLPPVGMDTGPILVFFVQFVKNSNITNPIPFHKRKHSQLLSMRTFGSSSDFMTLFLRIFLE